MLFTARRWRYFLWIYVIIYTVFSECVETLINNKLQNVSARQMAKPTSQHNNLRRIWKSHFYNHNKQIASPLVLHLHHIPRHLHLSERQNGRNVCVLMSCIQSWIQRMSVPSSVNLKSEGPDTLRVSLRGKLFTFFFQRQWCLIHLQQILTEKKKIAFIFSPFCWIVQRWKATTRTSEQSKWCWHVKDVTSKYSLCKRGASWWNSHFNSLTDILKHRWH